MAFHQPMTMTTTFPSLPNYYNDHNYKNYHQNNESIWIFKFGLGSTYIW